MKQNVGGVDRSIRGLVGIIAIALFALGILEGTLGIVVLVVGIVMLGTAAIGWCPPYSLLGINTCSVKESK